MDDLIVARAKAAFLASPPHIGVQDTVLSKALAGDFTGANRRATKVLRNPAAVASEIVDAQLGLATVALYQGRSEECGLHIEASEELVAPNTVQSVRTILAKAWKLLLDGSLEDGTFHAASLKFDKAAMIAARLGCEDERLEALTGQVDAVIGVGRHLEAIDRADETLALSVELGNYKAIPALLCLRATVMRDVGYREPAAETFEAALATLDVWSRPIWEQRARLGYGVLLSYRISHGNRDALETALAMLREGERIAVGLGAWPHLVEFRSAMAAACETAGDGERAAIFRRAESEAATEGGLHRQIRIARAITLRNEEESVLVEEGLRVAVEEDSSPFILFRRLLGPSNELKEFQAIYRNAAALRILDYEDHGLHLLSELEQKPHCRGFAGAIRRAALGETSEDEVELDTAAGRRIYRRRAIPSMDGAVLLLEDVTRFVEAVRTSEKLAKAKSEFLAHMSHEIRTPLNGVLGLAHLLEGSDLNEQQQSWIDGLLSSGDLLLRVINDILDVSKIEEGKLELASDPVSFAAIVRETAALNEPRAREKGLRLCLHIDPEVEHPVKGDAARLKQVLGNLVSNAIRYTERGEVRITAQRTEKGVRFLIADTGSGISPEEHGRIFAPFETGNLPESGTGLGLAIARRIVGLMGGELDLQSDAGAGSVFSFELPTVPAEDTGSYDIYQATELAMRILLVEDNDVNALVATGHLERIGCRVTRAVDGEEALRVASGGNEWDVVLMDVRLPGISGLQATQQLRRIPGFERLPIVAMTAGALLDEREACFEAGMDAYLSKPFRPRDLTDTLRRFIPD
ncbi:hypothetical protein BH11ARM2_BH11ARM2_26310 [soil metagenome]